MNSRRPVALLLLIGLTAAGFGASRAADRPAISVASAGGEIEPWCLTTGFIYKPAFLPRNFSPMNADFKPVFIPPAQAVIAVDGGDLSLDDCVGLGTIAQAWAKGARNIVIVAVLSVRPPYDMIGAKGIKRLEDLKGKTIASNGPQTTATKAIEAIMQHGANFVLDRDYTFVASGSTGARAAALRAGKVDAIPSTAPYDYKLEDEGFNLLGRELQYTPPGVEGILMANRDWAQKNRPLLVAVLKQVTQMGTWLHNPANKTDVLAKLGDYITMGEPAMGAAYAPHLYADFVLVNGANLWDGYADHTMFANALNLLSQEGIITAGDYPPLDKLVDYSYLNAARRELGLPGVQELR